MGQILGLGITHYPGLAFQGNLSRRIKMCLAGARPIGEDTGLADIKADAAAGLSPVLVPGTLSTHDALAEFCAHVHSFVDVGALKPLKIVADTANGMGGLIAPAVFSPV